MGDGGGPVLPRSVRDEDAGRLLRVALRIERVVERTEDARMVEDVDLEAADIDQRIALAIRLRTAADGVGLACEHEP